MAESKASTAESLAKAMNKRAFLMSEPDLSGFRVIIGFANDNDAFEAMSAIARLPKSPDPHVRRCKAMSLGSVPAVLRSLASDGSITISAGIVHEAANLLDDIDLLLGRLGECFCDDESEFADIRLMRDRIAAVDTRERHAATHESAIRRAPPVSGDV